MIVDSHVHLQPGRLAEAVRDFFRQHLDGHLLAYPLDHRATLSALHRAGVSCVWNLPYAHKPGVAAALNEASAQLVAAKPFRKVPIVGGATVHADDDDPAEVIRHALDAFGLRVVKLHCSVGGFDVSDARLSSMWSLLNERQVPAVVHAGHAIDGTTAAAELAGIAYVAARFPNVPLIIAHAGHPDTGAALDLIERHANVYADLTPCVGEPVALTDHQLESHADRLLFGTDAPNTAVPAEQGIARIRRLPPEAQDAILGGNARRLVG